MKYLRERALRAVRTRASALPAKRLDETSHRECAERARRTGDVRAQNRVWRRSGD